MKKEFTKMDYFLAGCMGVCLISYIASCFMGEPIENIKDLITYFGVGLGLTGTSVIVNSLTNDSKNKSEGENK